MKFKESLWKAYKGMGTFHQSLSIDRTFFDCGRGFEQLHDRKPARGLCPLSVHFFGGGHVEHRRPNDL